MAVGYFLTGEHRRYDSGNGTVGAIRVNRPWLRGAVAENRPYGYGAWEVAARFAYLDFVDADTPLGPNGQPQGLRLPQMTYWCQLVLVGSRALDVQLPIRHAR